MAFTGSAVWQVQADGSDTNGGGGFDAGVAGFPTDGAATLATSSAPVFTSASYTFVAGDVGAFVYIKSGTNWTAGWYPIVSVSTGAATLNAAIGASVLGTNSSLNTVAGCATTASPTAATWGIDYSQSATSRLTFTDMVIGGTTTQFTSSGNPVGKNFVGNIISVTSGTGFTVQRVAVVSTSGTTATCDKSLGTAASTGGNGRMGGALVSPGLCAGLVNGAGNIVYVKSGTYLVTSATTNISGGAISAQTATWVGYSSNRVVSNTDTQPIIRVSASTVTLTGAGCYYNLTFDGNAQTSAKLNSISQSIYIRCTCKNFTAVSTQVSYYYCSFTGYTVSAINGVAVFCEAYANTATPFNFSANANCMAFYCISRSNTGASTDGFSLASMNQAWGCVAYANGRDGFRTGTSGQSFLSNCHAEANSGWGFNVTTAYNTFLSSCSVYNNTSGATTGASLITTNFQTITGGSVFTNAAGGDFSLNNIAGQGASLRAVGVPGQFPVSPTTGYLDIGAVQHVDPSVVSLSRMFAGF